MLLRYFFDHQLRERAYSNRVRNELARLVLEPAYSSNISVTVLALALAVMVHRIVAPVVLGGWFAGMVVLFGIKLAAIFVYRRNQSSRAPDTLRSVDIYVVALVFTGIWWGMGVVLFFKPEAIVEQVAVIFVAAGLSAGSLPVLAPLRRLYYAYMLPVVLPLFVMLILQHGQLQAIMASVVVLYTLMLIKSATQTNSFLTTSLEMSYSHAELAENLKRARDESEALNIELRRENERRRATERELVQARDAAEAASRAKDEFLANMSHEIRTPMNGILGTLQLLQETEMKPSQQEFVRIAHTSAEGLLGILNDILDFSKIEARKLVLESIPVALRTMVEELTHLLARPAAEKGIVLSAEIDPALPALLLGDPTRIRQVISNLLTNAIKFTEGGRVTVRVVCAANYGSRAALRIEVTDTGIGIAKEKQAALFQSFTQADGSTTRKYGGTGLGLAIVRQLVLLMGGELGVESSPGHGATFWCALELPVAEGMPQAAAQTGQEAPPEVGLSGRVLLVEDNKVNQMVAMKMLTGLGFEVAVAENGELALQALGQQRFAVVLMDCQMPVLDGYAATMAWREIEKREGRARTPIIAMTAHAMEGDRDKCLAAGMDDYLAKPVQKEALAAKLRQWLKAPAGTA